MSTRTGLAGLTGLADLSRLVGAEWLKVRTTRLLHGTLPTAAAISAAAVAAAVVSSDGAGGTASERDIRDALSFTGTGALVVLVAGIVLAAGEHRHGTAVDTFLTTPRRAGVLAAKLVVGAALGLVAGILTAATSVAAAVASYRIEGGTFPLDSGEVWASLAGTLAYTTLFAVVGVGLGSLVRNQVVAVTAALAWIAVIEHIFIGFSPGAGRWLPFEAGQAIVRTPLDDLLSPLVATLVLSAYAAAFALAGAWSTATRDV